eukprot:CAMPEP_0201915996 /NCGR_PEP_ID=MMETSP0903-20130614/5759_1 /ASSEMBLY_ACC=CAM_ASM_000552 /TAXON_ID=420261 /ORGANISM="Thalassiosira antarctica, Strain CCMP982" /LENGTH=46 /DNA_ID= /DNA_START= /DNA_END= /DNA_ORIENTATION=
MTKNRTKSTTSTKSNIFHHDAFIVFWRILIDRHALTKDENASSNQR